MLVECSIIGYNGASDRADCIGSDGQSGENLPAGTFGRKSNMNGQNMELGAFSMSLAVKDLDASRSFYEKFGFQAVGGDATQNWLILRNASHTIGLFQGMFEKNMLTFNPGGTVMPKSSIQITDRRELQRQLKAQGVLLQNEADEATTGPAVFSRSTVTAIRLVDQHV